MHCPNCGQQVSQGSLYCRYCGKALQEEVVVRQGGNIVSTVFGVLVSVIEFSFYVLMLTLRIMMSVLRSIF